jgi:hypothetical protein
MFIVQVKQGKEEELALSILNKAQYYAQNEPRKKVNITSVLALRKKYPGKIFVEAYS